MTKSKIGPNFSPEAVEITSDEMLLELIQEVTEMEALGIAEPPHPLRVRPKVILPPSPPKDTWAADKILGAARIRAEAEANSIMRPDALRTPDLARADRIEENAVAPLAPSEFEIGAGGELVPRATAFSLTPHFKNTVQAPSYVTAAASRTRLDLADQCGVLETTLDLSDTIEARDSIERMLAAQMAILHRVTMQAGKRAAESLEYMQGAIDDRYREACSVQVTRMVNATARGTAEFQNAMLTLQKMRSGGKQNITVTHIQNTQVNEGGQAVVATGAYGLKTGGRTMNSTVNLMRSPAAMHSAKRCTAKSKRSGNPCKAPAVGGWAVCRMHGARGGAPKGERNGNYRHGLQTNEAARDQRLMRDCVRTIRGIIDEID